MPNPTQTEVRSFDCNPVCTLTPEALFCAGREIRFTDLRGFGVSTIRNRVQGTEVSCLHLAFRDGRNRWREMASMLPAADHPLVHALHERIPKAWVGTGDYMEVRKRLGFSNRLIIAIYVAIALFVLGFTAVIIIRALP